MYRAQRLDRTASPTRAIECLDSVLEVWPGLNGLAKRRSIYPDSLVKMAFFGLDKRPELYHRHWQRVIEPIMTPERAADLGHFDDTIMAHVGYLSDSGKAKEADRFAARVLELLASLKKPVKSYAANNLISSLPRMRQQLVYKLSGGQQIPFEVPKPFPPELAGFELKHIRLPTGPWNCRLEGKTGTNLLQRTEGRSFLVGDRILTVSCFRARVGAAVYVVVSQTPFDGPTTLVGATTVNFQLDKPWHPRLTAVGEDIYVTLLGGGMIRFRQGQAKAWTEKEGFPGFAVNKLVTIEGKVYLGTSSFRNAQSPGSLIEFDPEAETFNIICSSQEVEKKSLLTGQFPYGVRDLLPDLGRRSLWMVIEGAKEIRGLWRYDLKEKTFERSRQLGKRVPEWVRQGDGDALLLGPDRSVRRGKYVTWRFDPNTGQVSTIGPGVGNMLLGNAHIGTSTASFSMPTLLLPGAQAKVLLRYDATGRKLRVKCIGRSGDTVAFSGSRGVFSWLLRPRREDATPGEDGWWPASKGYDPNMSRLRAWSRKGLGLRIFQEETQGKNYAQVNRMAVAFARRAIALGPLSPQAYCAVDSLLWDGRNYDEQIAAASAWIKAFPDGPTLYFDRALGHFAAKRYEQALADIDKVIAGYTFRLPYLTMRGNILMAAGRLRQAIESYTRVIDAFPTYWPAWQGRALCYLMMGEYQRATADLDAIHDLRQGRISDGGLSKGGESLAYVHTGDFGKADIWSDNRSSSAWIYIYVTALLRNQDPLAALRAYDAMTYDWRGQEKKGGNCLKSALADLERGTWPAPIVRFYEGKLTAKECLAASARAIGRNPDEARQRQRHEAAALIGLWYWRQNQRDNARPLFEEIVATAKATVKGARPATGPGRTYVDYGLTAYTSYRIAAVHLGLLSGDQLTADDLFPAARIPGYPRPVP